jgi:hypothetical protein
MRKILTLLPVLITLLTLQANAQNIQTRISEYNLPMETASEKIVVIKMNYANFNVTTITGDTTGLKNAGDLVADIVYTDYPSQLSLQTLNQSRLNELFRLFPFIRYSQIRQTNYLRQTDGSEKEKAQTMFHGIVIRYRPVQNESTMQHDLLKLDEMISTETDTVVKKIPLLLPDKVSERVGNLTIIEKKDSHINTEKDNAVPGSIPSSSYIELLFLKGKKILTLIGDEKNARAYYHIPDSLKIMSPAEAYKNHLISKAMFTTHKKYNLTVTTLFDYVSDSTVYDFKNIMEDSSNETASVTKPLPDSTVFKIFKRNSWKNINVVGDVTGSMYPYTGQLLLWLKLHSLDSLTNRFVFFNDGDNTPDNKKKIGKTGGVYYRQCKSFEEVKDLVKTTMMKGGGGDCPENNIEALLAAEKQFPDASCQVLIADNWANIKDMELTMQLTKPVRIVLCGVYDYNVNINYLNLARKTKGSVHLMEQDLYNLSLLHEGEVLKIGRKNYKVKKGEFVEVDLNGEYIYPVPAKI